MTGIESFSELPPEAVTLPGTNVDTHAAPEEPLAPSSIPIPGTNLRIVEPPGRQHRDPGYNYHGGSLPYTEPAYEPTVKQDRTNTAPRLSTSDSPNAPSGVKPRSLQELLLQGECSKVDPNVFFPDDGPGVEAAKKICRQCAYVVPCLDAALQERTQHGVRGGTSERQRRRMLK